MKNNKITKNDNMKNDGTIKPDDKFVIFHAEGGHGKMCVATAVCRALKKAYPDRKLIVVTAWDGPFFYNPDVWRFYTFGQMQYFYDDYINADTKIFRQEVYHTEDHILQRKHIVQSWCDMIGIPSDGITPKIYLNPRELEIAKDKIKPDGRPIMLLQTHGGSPTGQYSKKSWYRDMPIEIAQKLANYFSKSYRILHIKAPEQPVLQNVEPLILPFRELYAVFPLSTKRLFIDSFSQHVAAALDLQSTVVWIGNKPEVFGYPEHINISPNANYVRELNKFSYLDQFDISGQIQQFPYDTVNLLDVNQIIDAVNRQK
jgi:ADP-heptose:LPS heptosyltransferase